MTSREMLPACTTHRCVSVLFALPLLASTALACGNGDSGGTAAASGNAAAAASEPIPDPCTLLTTAEVQQQLGWSVTATTDTTSMAGRGNCEYAATTENRKLWLYLSPSTGAPSPDHYSVNAESYTNDMGFKDIEFIDDIGNAAMWLPEARQLTVVVPGYEVQVIDMTASGEASLSLAQARALMQKALERLN